MFSKVFVFFIFAFCQLASMEEIGLKEKRNQAIRKCCPTVSADDDKPMFCCLGLFDHQQHRHRHRLPLWECDKYGMQDSEKLRIMRCAQYEMNANSSVNICTNSCCSLFNNVAPPEDTRCTGICASLLGYADLTIDGMINLLRHKRHCHGAGEMHIQAFKNCVTSMADGLLECGLK